LETLALSVIRLALRLTNICLLSHARPKDVVVTIWVTGKHPFLLPAF
jgi:hypothetical protein